MAHPFADDPVLRLLPSEPPGEFMALPADEQAWRGRYFLMAWVLHGQSLAYAWWAALANEPDHNRDAKAAVATSDDRLIIEAVKIANEEMAARRDSEHVSVQ